MNHYEVLGVAIDADTATIRRAFQDLAKQYHPDKSSEDTKERFHHINEAWRVLSEDSTRKEYDGKLKRQKLYQEFPVSEELYIEDLRFIEEKRLHSHECRCGGHFTIQSCDIADEEELIVSCDNCSLTIKVIIK
ncbi:DPH4 homolog isoform X2 [Oratosquilla oratoria]